MIAYSLPLRGIKFSTNKIYAGIHWTKRKEIKDSIHGYVLAFCRPVRQPESYPVEIRYNFFFGSRPLDTLNTAAMAKMLEDALRATKILKDDDPRYVTRSILEVNVVPEKKRPKTAGPQGKQGHAEDEDRVDITITSL
jgi:hypothetical protein